MHEVEGATWCEPKRRNGRLRQAEASPVCAQTRDRARARHGRCREHRRRSAEGRGGPWRRGACEGRSLSRERRPGALPQLRKRVVEMPRTLKDNEALPACRLRKRRAPLNERGFEGGAAPSELAKGVQGETAAIGRVSLRPFLYAAPRAAGRGR